MSKVQNSGEIFVILLWKELLHTFRDKDVLIYTFIVPAVIYPLLLVAGMELFIMVQESSKGNQTTYGVTANLAGKERLQNILKVLANDKDFARVEGPVSRADLFSGRIKLLLDEREQTSSLSGRKATQVVAEVPASIFYDTPVGKLNTALSADYASALDRALTARKLSPADYKIEKVVEKNVNKGKSEVFSVALGLLFFSLFNVALGGAYPAIAATSEEFERHTIEPTLMLPVNRWFMVAAKLVAISSLALLAGSLNLFSMFADSSLALAGSNTMRSAGVFDLSVKVQPDQVPYVVLSYIVIAIVYSSLLMLTAAYCRTVRSSQQWISLPLTIFMLAPMVALIPTVELNNWTACIPILNNLLATRSLFNGDLAGWPHFIAFIELPVILAVTTKLTSTLVYERGD